MKIAANVQESQARVARLLPQTTPAVARVLERAMAGHELSREEGVTLATLPKSDLEALTAVADHVRREVVGDMITYVVNRNINFTNVCFIGCSFCFKGDGPTTIRRPARAFARLKFRRAAAAVRRGSC